MTAKRIVILGSTGSIGTQALEVIAANRDKFQVVGLAAGGGQPDLLVQQAREHGLAPEHVAVARQESARAVSEALGGRAIDGPDAAARLVESVEADTVLNAMVGSQGLGATMATIESGAVLALANKESLVAGGALVTDGVERDRLVPVDSEHSAMAQCLAAGERAELDHLVLTASGGPFRGRTREQMWDVTPQEAAQHPTWSMGQMNTLNSATLVNKGLELIEASLLFDLPPERIAVTVHAQSIVHSMATFTDGCTIAQASPPSMKLPISLALDWPHRVPGAQPALDFSQAYTWEFAPLDDVAFPAVTIAREAASRQGSVPAVYNAANEEAAAAFLAGRIHFPQIVDVVERAVDTCGGYADTPSTVADVLAVENEARRRANEHIDALTRSTD